MLTDSPLHEKLTTHIPAASVTPRGNLSLAHLIRLFQEAAMQNTVRLAISSPELMKDYSLTWILHRQYIKAERWPRMGEAVEIITAPTRIERKLLTYRDFYLTDKNGQTLITSSSCWMVMDIKSRRLKAIPQAVSEGLGTLPPPSDHLPFPTEKLSAPASDVQSQEFTVGFSHLDFNYHLTNPAYSELMIEPLGLQFLDDHYPTYVDISYQKEARYGDTVTVYVDHATDESTYLHALRKGGDLLALMRTEWKKY